MKFIKKEKNFLKVKNHPNELHASRRKFLKSGLLATCGFITSCSMKGNKKQFDIELKPGSSDSCIDYGRSFICNTAEFNSVRMWVESRTIITDTKSGLQNVYYQCASCKSENTFGSQNLFYKDNYDFLPIFGKGKVLVFRRHVNKRNDGYRTIKNMEEMWGENPVIYAPIPKVIKELDTWEKIRDATAAGIPIVTRTEISNEDTGLKAVIECPCKTINISHPEKMYQVDTGPIAFPDISKLYDLQINCLSLAFIAFNQSHFADFVIEVPTAIIENDKEITTVYHYSKIVSMNSINKLFALGDI